MYIEVFDNGKGMDESTCRHIKAQLESECDLCEHDENDNNIGLKNVNNRIRSYFGIQYGLQVESEENLYTKIIVKLPYHHD